MSPVPAQPQIIDPKPVAACETCAVRRLCLPVALNDRQLNLMDEIVRARPRFETGDHLYWAGDPFQSLYAIKQGAVKAFGLTSDGEEQVTGFFLPGELVGLDAIEQGVHHCNAVALQDTEVCESPFAGLQRADGDLGVLSAELINIMSREIRAECRMLTLVGKMTAEQRVACFLQNVQQRLSLRAQRHVRVLELPMSRQDIGNYLGLTLETVSRRFSALRSGRIIDIDQRQITIRDRDALAALCVY